MKRLLDTEGGVIRTWMSDNEGTCAVRATQDAEPVLKFNELMRQERQMGELRLIATINRVMFEEMLRLEGLTMRDYYQKLARYERDKVVRNFISDSDYSKFRAVDRL